MNNSDMNKKCEIVDWDDGSFEHRFFSTLMRINRLLRQHVEQELTDIDLSPPQMWFLKRLAHAGEPQPISFFADGVFSNRSNATQMIDRLEAEELVKRVKNPKDRRSVLVELTDLGSQRLIEAHHRHEKLIGDLLAPLSSDDRDKTLEALEGVLELLNN